MAIASPRKSAKSTVITHVFTLYSVLFRAHDHVLILSDTEGQAIQFLSDIKMELIENQKLIQLFGPVRFIKEAEKEIQVELGSDKHKFRIIAKGAETSLRGMKWRHKRPNLVIGDDMENDESVMSEDRRNKLKKWFLGALVPAISENGRIVIVGTILHFDSLLESLMPDTLSKSTVTDGLKTYTTSKSESGWMSIKYRAHTDIPDDFTEILWPENFTEIKLREIRAGYIKQGFPEGYAQEYLNYPIDSTVAFFRHADMIGMTDEDRDRNESRLFSYYAALDAAVTKQDRRSYTAIVVGGMDSMGILHIVEVVRERMDTKEIVDWMFALQTKYNLDLFVVETGAIEKAFGPFLLDEMFRKDRPFINLVTKVPTKDKKSRASAIQGRMRSGGVRFDREATWWPVMMEEMLRFDRGEHDDQVDALAWLGLTLNEITPGKTIEEVVEDEYIEELETFDYDGRNDVTGY